MCIISLRETTDKTGISREDADQGEQEHIQMADQVQFPAVNHSLNFIKFIPVTIKRIQ